MSDDIKGLSGMARVGLRQHYRSVWIEDERDTVELDEDEARVLFEALEAWGFGRRG